MLTRPTERLASPICGKPAIRFVDTPMLHAGRRADPPTMWLVTSTGDLPDDFEQRDHQAAADAWSDY